MKVTTSKLSGFVAFVASFGLAQACAQESGEVADISTDTAVHNAEVAQGDLADVLAQGEALYKTHCSACHQPNGEGMKGVFPPLADSDFLTGDRKAVLAAALFGLSGPITVNGVDYNGVMPSVGYLSDEELAAVLT